MAILGVKRQCSGTDAVAHQLANSLQEELSQTVNVVNRTGWLYPWPGDRRDHYLSTHWQLSSLV